jgi:hypothetical protein
VLGLSLAPLLISALTMTRYASRPAPFSVLQPGWRVQLLPCNHRAALTQPAAGPARARCRCVGLRNNCMRACVAVCLCGCGGGLLLGAAAREVMTLWIALPEDPDDPEEPPPASGGKARQQRGPPGRCAHASRAGRNGSICNVLLLRAPVARSFSDLHVRVCVL